MNYLYNRRLGGIPTVPQEPSDVIYRGQPAPTLTLIVGPPGAGKSTYVSKTYNQPGQKKAFIVNFDQIRLAHGSVFCEADETKVENLALKMIAHGLREGMDVVVDESVTTIALAQTLLGSAKLFDYPLRTKMVEMDTNVEVCYRRRVKDGGMSHGAFMRKLGEWLENRSTIIKMAHGYSKTGGQH